MWLSLLAAAAMATPPPATIAQKGPTLPGATVTRIEFHPEYQRVHLELDDLGPLPVEIVRDPEGTRGVCRAQGLALQPRVELVGLPLDLEPLPPAIQVMCDRLHAVPVDTVFLAPAAAEAGPHAEPTRLADAPMPPSRAPAPLPTALGLGVVLSLLGALVADRRRLAWHTPALLGLLALGLRLVWSPRWLFNGHWAGHEKLQRAWNLLDDTGGVGAGIGVLHAPLNTLLGPSVTGVQITHLLFSAALAPVLFGLGRLLLGHRVGLLLGLLAAVAPHAIALGATEVFAVPGTTLLWLSAAAALAYARGAHPLWGAVAVLAAGFSAHLRPELVPMALLPLLMLWGTPRRRWHWAVGGALLLLGLLGHRAMEVLAHLPPGAERNLQIWDPRLLMHLMLPHLGPSDGPAWQVFLTAAHSPPPWALLVPIALLAAVRVPALRGPVALAGAAWLLTLMPVATKGSPWVDGLRLQLPAQPAAWLLVAIGADHLLRHRAHRLPLVAMVLALCALPSLWLSTRGLVHQRSSQVLLALLPQQTSPALVLYDDAPNRAPHFGAVMARLSPPGVQWMGIGAWLQSGPAGPVPTHAWKDVRNTLAPAGGVPPGSADSQLRWAALEARCAPTPDRVRSLANRPDRDLAAGDLDTVGVGFWTVRGCAPP